MKHPDAWQGIMRACWKQALKKLAWDDFMLWTQSDSHQIAEQMYAMNKGWA